jgi:hypothetical protein
MSRLLFLGHVWPEPTSSAAGQRTLRLLRLLRGAGWQITFACAAAVGEHATDLGHLEVETAPITLNCSSFDEFVGDLAPEVVVFDRFMTEEQFGWRVERAVPSAVRVLDTVDLHFLRRARQRAAATGDARVEPELHGEDAWREIASILRVDLALVISQVEHDLLTCRFPVPAQQLQYVPFLLEPDEPRRPGFEARAGFATIGNFRHPPNLDSVRWLHREIWPAVRRLLPSAQLTVHGAYPPAEAMALHDPARGFLVVGRAEDAVEALTRVRVCLAPLRFGAGLKGKLVDAMLAGTPSVTTSVGAEGIADEEGWPGAVAADAEELARQAVSLHDDPTLWAAAHQHGFDVLRERFDGAAHGARLVERLDMLREGLEAHRSNNFVGAMLRHHHQRSTEFMGRWIEEKNRAR